MVAMGTLIFVNCLGENNTTLIGHFEVEEQADSREVVFIVEYERFFRQFIHQYRVSNKRFYQHVDY